ncbi:hypothetical protein SO694_00115081 [Aureococcus anophagefferens]|uniref:TFIIS N-terminal domain-containing protein n=1 Tax=Aureococcus anophagefferens TaxID=44056 RepID=A0ABR1FWJ1_AURAN
MGIIPFPVCRVGVSSERRKKLDALARALREARDGGADAARLLRDLFSARVEFNEIAGLDLGGRDGVLDSLRKAGSDGQRRAAKRLINAWNRNRIVVDGRAVEERLRRATTKRKAAGGARRRGGEEEEEEWRDDAPDDDDEDDVAVFPGGEEAEWSE